MSEKQNVQSLLNSLNAPPQTQTKVASSNTQIPVQGASADSIQQLSHLLQQSKVASAVANTADAVDHLEKIAADVEAAESLALEKQAQLFGAAFADAAMARLTGYEQVITKVAASAASMKGLKPDAKPAKKPDAKPKPSKAMPAALKKDLQKNASAQEVQRARDAGAYDGDTLVKIARADQEWNAKTAAAREVMSASFNAGVASVARVLGQR